MSVAERDEVNKRVFYITASSLPSRDEEDPVRSLVGCGSRLVLVQLTSFPPIISESAKPYLSSSSDDQTEEVGVPADAGDWPTRADSCVLRPVR